MEPTQATAAPTSRHEGPLHPIFRYAGLFALACMLAVGIAYEREIAEERAGRRDEVGNEIASGVGGPVTLVGPLLYVELEHKRTFKSVDSKPPVVGEWTDKHVIAPDTMKVQARTNTTRRHRGVFDIPVFDASATADTQFKLPKDFLKAHPPQDAKEEVRIAAARLVFWSSSNEGLVELPTLRQGAVNKRMDIDAAGGAGWYSAALDPQVLEGGTLSASLEYHLQGSRQIGWTPVAAEQKLELYGDWSSPSFFGSRLPIANQVRPDGYMASWATMPSLRRIAADAIVSQSNEQKFAYLGEIEHLDALGVRFVEPVDLYALCVRATKYGMMFVMVTIGGLLLVEALTKRRLSIAAHGLVGASLSLFFVLLLAYAEHIGFGKAYGVASAACLLVNSAFLSRVLGSLKIGAMLGAVLGAVYTAMYVMLRSEDSALLMGSSLLFLLVSGAMFLLRGALSAGAPDGAERASA